MNLLTSKGIGIAMSTDQPSLSKIKTLRYTCYQDVDAIEPRLDQTMTDLFDSKASTINLYAGKEGQILGAIRGCIYDPLQTKSTLPAFKVYNEEIQQAIGTHHSIYESCRFVVHPETNARLRVHFTLVKAAILTAWSLELDYIITACRKRHMEFYIRMGMEQISEEKIYPGLKVPMVLLASEISDAKRILLCETYKALAFDKSDLFTYRNKLLLANPELHHYLTIQTSHHVRA